MVCPPDKQAMKKFENEVAQLLEKGVPETEMRRALLKAGCPEELIAKVISDAKAIEEEDKGTIGTIGIDFSKIFGGVKKTNADPSKIKHYYTLRIYGRIFKIVGAIILIVGVSLEKIVEQPLWQKVIVFLLIGLVALPFLAFDDLIDLLIDNTQANQSATNYLKQLAGKK